MAHFTDISCSASPILNILQTLFNPPKGIVHVFLIPSRYHSFDRVQTTENIQGIYWDEMLQGFWTWIFSRNLSEKYMFLQGDPRQLWQVVFIGRNFPSGLCPKAAQDQEQRKPANIYLQPFQTDVGKTFQTDVDVYLQTFQAFIWFAFSNPDSNLSTSFNSITISCKTCSGTDSWINVTAGKKSFLSDPGVPGPIYESGSLKQTKWVREIVET